MFRISFDPAIGRFVIQVLRFGLFWVNVQKSETSTSEPILNVSACNFHTYDDARKYVTSIGLDQLYKDRSENVRRSYMSADMRGAKGYSTLRDPNGEVISHKEYAPHSF